MEPLDLDMPLVVYLSHPIGEADGVDAQKRADNIANAGEWVRYFVDTTRWVIMMPWFVYVITHGETIHAPRRLIDQLTALERCDLFVQVGGYISPHMLYEARAAKRLGIPVIDLTDLGISPPDVNTVPYRDDEDTTQLILSRVQRIVSKGPRRVWLPLITDQNLEALKKLRHDVDIYMPTEHKDGVDLLDRIIQSALDRGKW